MCSFLACHMSFTKWRFWKLMQDQKMQLDGKTMVTNPRSSNGRCSKKEKVWVRKQHWAVEGSQTGPLEDGTWGILAICLSFVLSYKVSAPFIMLRQRGAWLWYREYGLVARDEVSVRYCSWLLLNGADRCTDYGIIKAVKPGDYPPGYGLKSLH